jgi:hypothetical protein
MSLFALHNETRWYLSQTYTYLPLLTSTRFSQYSYPSDSIYNVVIFLDTLRQFFRILVRWPRSRIHRVRSRLSVQQCALAHDGGVRPPYRYGILCPGRLCRHWLVCGIIYFCCQTVYAKVMFFRLISASVGTVVYYGFQCYPHVGQVFLVCCLLTGIAGNIFPFMDWFNQYEYRASHIT